MIDIFSALGYRLAAFGKTPDTVEVVRRAAVENPWFLPQEIIRAVKAIRCEMLERQRLEAWAGAYPPVRTPKRVLVVMAGNIPLVGFFDLLCVLASGHACRVKPSSKDTVLIGYVVDLLRTIDPAIPLRMAEQGERPDAVIATGSDNANRYFRMLFGGIPKPAVDRGLVGQGDGGGAERPGRGYFLLFGAGMPQRVVAVSAARVSAGVALHGAQ